MSAEGRQPTILESSGPFAVICAIVDQRFEVPVPRPRLWKSVVSHAQFSSSISNLPQPARGSAPPRRDVRTRLAFHFAPLAHDFRHTPRPPLHHGPAISSLHFPPQPTPNNPRSTSHSARRHTPRTTQQTNPQPPLKPCPDGPKLLSKPDTASNYR